MKTWIGTFLMGATLALAGCAHHGHQGAERSCCSCAGCSKDAEKAKDGGCKDGGCDMKKHESEKPAKP